MLKIGVIGVGHLGKIHLNILKNTGYFNLIGFFDIDRLKSAEAVQQFSGLKEFKSLEELIDLVDVVDIVTPTLSHYDCAVKALKMSKHVFIEKPLSNTLEEAKDLMSLADEANVKVQVGHVERFNPAFIAATPYFKNPLFIETHRLAQFNPRGTDVSVVMDLMIHDIDIILSIVNSNIKKIHASGVAVVSDTPDIANARIEFDNGCVANLTASRISLKNMRKSRFFQHDAYISVDFYKRKTEIIRIENATSETDPLSMIIDLGENKGKRVINFDLPKVEESNAIQEELRSFSESIQNNTEPLVTIHDGYQAMLVAEQIIEKLHVSKALVS